MGSHSDSQLAVDPYDAAISTFVGLHEPDDMREHRRRLLKARDWAARQMSNPHSVHPESLPIYDALHFHAGRWCYALPTSVAERDLIARALRNCRRLGMVAGSIASMGAGCGE